MAGNTSVTISGTNFVAGATVAFDGVAATGVTVVSTTSLTAITPAGAQGFADVTVTNVDLLSDTLVNGYDYLGAPPVISGISPSAVLITDTTTDITISGSGFATGIIVTIQGQTAPIQSVTGTAVVVRLPASGLSIGPAPVVVTNVDLQTTTYNGFIVQGPAPTIGTIAPTNGPMAGGTTVVISGTNFVAGATVTFDGVAAASTTLVNSSTIQVVTAAGAQGPADVVVTNVDLRSVTRTNGFIFEGPAPTVTGVVATSGPTSGTSSGDMAGGTNVTITGTNFAAGATVTFDGVAAIGVTFVSANSLTATTPAGAQGFADVTVTNVDLLSDTLVNGYDYLGVPPVVSGISPGAVPINYLTTDITITGSGFAPGVTVTIQGQSVPIRSMSGTSIVVRLPASGLTPGAAPVVITNVDAQTTTFNGFIVQGPAPILTGIDVPYGPVAGGRRMTLTGSAFRSGAVVTLGGVPATIQSLSATTIVALTPAHAEGAVTVTVTNDDLLSSSLVNAYTYYTHTDESTTGNGCGTGGGLAILLFFTFLTMGGGFGRRR
jgi:hypothetical protein